MKMKMNKIIIGVVVLALVLGVNVAIAANQPEGTPFKAIWEAISDLQDQIDELVASGGEQGPPGPQGPAGPQGPQGEPGLAGSSLKVVDANGDEVGLFTAFNPSDDPLGANNYIVWNPDVNKFLQLNWLTGQQEGWLGANTYYKSDNCSGQPIYSFGGNIVNTNFIYIIYIDDQTLITATLDVNDFKYYSVYSEGFGNGDCQEASGDILGTTNYTPVTLPTFVGPLHIIEQ